MRRADRLFEIIQVLRTATTPVTAEMLADRLEVTSRTIYRDMAVLQSQRVPIAGEAGVGYIMRAGFDLPPLMFTDDEVEAIVVGLGLLNRTGDTGLQDAATRVSSKISSVLPDNGRQHIDAGSLQVFNRGATAPPRINLSDVRAAIRDEREITLIYTDENETSTKRTIQPIGVLYFTEVVVIAAWCKLRKDFRHFRADRIIQSTLLDSQFTGHGGELRQQWMDRHETISTKRPYPSPSPLRSDRDEFGV